MCRYRPHLLLVLTTLFWSGNFVVARAVHLSLPPLSMSFWRWLLALLILLPIVFGAMRAEWPQIRRHWRILLLLATLGVANFNSFVYLGLQQTLATNAVLLQSLIPAVVMLLSVLMLGLQVSGRQWLGMLLALVGALCIVLRGDWRLLVDLQVNRGDLWLLAAVLSWALYSVCLRWRPDGLSDKALLGTTVSIGVLLLLPFYLWELGQGARIGWVPANLMALAYVAVFPSVLAYFFWNYGVSKLGAARAGMFIYLMPLFGTGLSMQFLGERLADFHLIGFTLVMGGILLASRQTSQQGR